MATTPLQFSAIVNDWCKAQPQRMEAVWKESTQRTVSLAQDRVPVDTGFLRASIRASTDSMPPIEPTPQRPKGLPKGVAGSSFPYTGADIITTISGAKLGQTIFVGYTAGYAGFVEYGTVKMAPRPFVGLAAEQWPVTVRQVVTEAQSRAGR